MVESRRRDPTRGAREILKTGTLEMRFPAIWSPNFSCSSGNFAGFGNPIIQERHEKLHGRGFIGYPKDRNRDIKLVS